MTGRAMLLTRLAELKKKRELEECQNVGEDVFVFKYNYFAIPIINILSN